MMHKAVRFWVSLLLVSSLVGCAGLRSDNDALSAYSMPGEVDPNRGMFTKTTENLISTAKSSLGLGPNEAAAQEQFKLALDRYRNAAQLQGAERRKQFEKAAGEFAKSAARWPGSSIEEDAMFYRAESFFFADRYPKAEEVFGQLVGKHQSTRHLDKISQRRFQIAKYWLDHHELGEDLPFTPNLLARDRPTFDKFGYAIKTLERIRLDDPTGELADDATMLAASACFEDGRYYRADELLEDLRRYFPNSKHQYDAHRLGLKCKIQLYQGPEYDSGPLDDAEELVKQMRRQFPNESRQHDELLTKAYKDVRMNRAIREITLARYRDRRQEYRAARAQYARVAREYSDTSLASEAEERLAQLGDSPDLPPQRLEWLARVFPSDESEQPLLATRPDRISR